MKQSAVVLMLVIVAASLCFAQQQFESDILKTAAGDLRMTFIGHGTLMFEFNGLVIHIDPYGRVADYSKLPKADIILVTHSHGDHLDSAAIEKIRLEKTSIIFTSECAPKVKDGIVMKNGESQTLTGITIETVPAYNIVQKRPDGDPFHPKGAGNGYILTFGDKKVYVAGDTENTPEMKALKNIDVAFLPMNLPYTMTPEMVADAAKAFRPKILYPYHFGNTATATIADLLRDVNGIEVRIRKLQ
ncbi:MAG: MBL fold metallo-hydrolase [bacterium]